jgi:transcription elongation factor GreB
VVAWAAGNGDRSENADYIYGKRRLREIDRRIRFLTRRLEAVEIVDPAKQKSDQVLFGATVTVVDEEGKKKTYSIVGVDEVDLDRHYISWHSPIGKALLQSRVEDVVSFHTPQGVKELEVVSIIYQSLE